MAERPRDPYEVLGLRSGASEAQIKQAYKVQAAIAHPDAPAGSESLFQLIQAAYEECLRREHEDRWGTSSSTIGSGIQAPLKQIQFKLRR